MVKYLLYGRTMSKDEIRAARQALGLSCEKFAQVVGVASGRTIRRWESGELRPRKTAAILIRRLVADAEYSRIVGAAE